MSSALAHLVNVQNEAFPCNRRKKEILQRGFLKSLSNGEAAHSHKKAAVNLQKEVPLELLNCVRKSEEFYYSNSKCS